MLSWLKRGLGRILLRGAEEYLLAEPMLARKYALRAFELHRMTGDAASIAAAADVAAQACYLTGDYRMSRRYGAAAYRIYRRRGDHRAMCTILAVLSGTALRLGRGEAALAHAQRSYALAREIDDPLLVTVGLGNLSQALTAWGRYQEAVQCATDAIRLMDEHGLAGNRNYVIMLNTLGMLYAHLNQDAMAAKCFRRALAIAEKAGDASMQAMLQSNRGLLRCRYRHWKKSLPFLQKALELAHRAEDLPKEGEISLNVTRVLIELGRLEDAMVMLVRAFMLARRSRNRELEWLVITAESRLFEKQNRIEESARSAERALSMAAEFGSDAHRMVAMHTFARSCILLQQLERAAALLQEVVRLEEALSRALRDEALLTSVFDVQVSAYEDLQWVQVQLGRHAEALVSAERGRARVLARQVAERDAATDTPPDFDEIRQFAAELKTTFLVVSLVRDPADLFEQEPQAHAFIWAVPPDRTIPMAFHRSPSLRDASSAADQDLRSMHDWFIAPVAHALPIDPLRVVTIVPIGPLAVEPFAAARDADGISFIERHPIAMTPSIQTLQLAIKREGRGEGALVIGNPGADLPSAGAEAEFIANEMRKRMATDLLKGRDATHDAVVRLMPGKQLLHFASHAVFDSGDEASDYGALLLGDGRLTAEEIRGKPLDADLVVLSACDTGQGRIAADGVLGLARSFILAGARSVVATLWKIDEEPTRLLIEHFYEQMAVHGHKARALQEAMLHVKAMPDYAEPYHWAGFVLIGPAGP